MYIKHTRSPLSKFTVLSTFPMGQEVNLEGIHTTLQKSQGINKKKNYIWLPILKEREENSPQIVGERKWEVV